MYIQPGTEAPKVTVQTGRAYVTPSSAPVGNHVQAGAEKPAAVGAPTGLPFVTSPAVNANYVQPDVRSVVEVQQARPHVAASPSHTPYQQPGTAKPETVHHRVRLSSPNVTIPYYQQPGTNGPSETTIDPGLATVVCPADGTIARHIGSSQYQYRCANGHYVGPDATGFLVVAFFGGITPNKFQEPTNAFVI